MSNTNANQYPLWLISNNLQVFAAQADGKLVEKSKVGFASELGISEDGTLWALSTSPDPDGGGAKLYWSVGDGNWTEINTADPGGVEISGADGSDCFFLDSSFNLRRMTPQGQSTIIDQGNLIFDFDYGNGYFWALMAPDHGKNTTLYFAQAGAGKLNWTAFSGNPLPYNLSVNYQGNCYCILDGEVWYFLNDGTSSNKFASIIDGPVLTTSFKNWSYALSAQANQDGNVVLEWKDIAGGQFQPTNFRAAHILATYYTRSES